MPAPTCVLRQFQGSQHRLQQIPVETWKLLGTHPHFTRPESMLFPRVGTVEDREHLVTRAPAARPREGGRGRG